jgi:hypothetical protein
MPKRAAALRDPHPERAVEHPVPARGLGHHPSKLETTSEASEKSKGSSGKAAANKIADRSVGVPLGLEEAKGKGKPKPKAEEQLPSAQELSLAEQAEGMFTDDPTETLRKHLQLLQTKDPRCIFIVRKINRLGFDSPTLLQQHYQKYGVVEAVLVAHSRVRCQNRSLVPWRVRPSGLGFVVMQEFADVQAILAQGETQTVRDASIRLSPFKQKEDDEGGLLAGEADNQD